MKSTISELTNKITALEAQLRDDERIQLPAASASSSGCFENVDYHSLYESGQNRIVKLEAMLRDLQVDLRSSELTHASEIRTLRDDLDQLR